MASTYTYFDVISFLAEDNPRLNQDAKGTLLLDQLNSLIWNKADWRFAIAEMPPFFLTAGDQDYGPPQLVIPADFNGLRTADLTYNFTSIAYTYPPLDIKRHLDKTNYQGMPEAISFEPSTQKFRVYPRTPQGVGACNYQIGCTYKQKPVRVSASTIATTALPSDDQYFNVWASGLDWLLHKGDQARLGLFQEALATMEANEALNLGVDTLYPGRPLVDWGW